MRGLLRRFREWRDAREEYRASVEEMGFHVEQEAEHNLRQGMSPREARRAALKAFGGIDRFAEAAHDARPGTRWSEFRMSWLDWKLGMRMLAKYPGMSVIGGITLAAAMGLGAGWFAMTKMLFDPRLPLEDGGRIVRIEYWDAGALRLEQRTMHEFVQWRDQLASIEDLGAYRTVERNLLVPGRPPQIVRVAEMSAAGFDVARVPPLLGRPLIDADEEPGSDDVTVIGYGAWQRYFDGDGTVIGREVQLGPVRMTIVGVMPEGYGFPVNHEFWIPLRARQTAPLEGAAISVFGRLRTGASMESAGAELAAWGARMAQLSPATHERLQLRVLPYARGERSARREAFLLHLAAWLILVLACTNVAALMFARTALRESEIVVRNALGASRVRVMGQLFTEALVLTSASAVVGLIGARAAIAFALGLTATRHRPPPFWMEAGIEPATILYTALLAVAGAGMVALLPALRVTGRHVRAELSQIGSGGTSMRFGGTWSAIIVMQVALSVLCLPFGISAALEAYRETRLRSAYPADPYLTFRPVIDTESAGASGAMSVEWLNAVMDELAQRLLDEREVAGVTVTTALPGLYHPLARIEAQRESEPPFVVQANTDGQRVRVGGVGPGFFETFQMPLIGGREFRTGDVGATHRVVVINESMARNIGGNAIGVRVRFAAVGDEEPGPWHEVIGVARNFGLTPTGRGEADFMYTPVSAAEASWMVVRVNGGADQYAQRLRTVAMQVDPSLRLHDVLSLRETIRREDQGVISMVLIGIGIVLLIVALSAASLYALMSVAVALRTREVGIRVAIGANSRAVLTSLFRRVAIQVGIGVIAGNIIVGVALNMMMDVIRPAAVVPPMAAASLIMLLVGLGACLVPARRALRIQPTDALKQAR